VGPGLPVELLQQKRLDQQVIMFGPAIERDDRATRHMEIDLEVRHGVPMDILEPARSASPFQTSKLVKDKIRKVVLDRLVAEKSHSRLPTCCEIFE
jgi:hypothetical protein